MAGLAKGHSVYAALDQAAVQKLVHNVFLSRPHYFTYATAALGGGSTDVSLLPTIPVPGSNSGVDFTLRLSEPVISFFDAAFPPPLGPLTANQFGLQLNVTICISQSAQMMPLRAVQMYAKSRVLSPPPALGCATITVAAVGSLTTQTTGSNSEVGFWVQGVAVSGTGNLDPLIANILQQVLNYILAPLQLSASAIAQGVLSVRLAGPPDAPEINGQALQVWADLG
jgi:hypothetical protein